MPVTGPNRIAVDALGRNALAAPALNRIVDAQHNRPGRRKGSNQQAKHKARNRPRTPGGTVQHTMVVDEASLMRKARDAQDAGHGARA